MSITEDPKNRPRIYATRETDTLHAHITQAIGAVQNSLVTRRDHPTYGYTKTKIRADLDQAEGMLIAWCLITRRMMSVRCALPDDLPEVNRLRELRDDLRAA